MIYTNKSQPIQYINKTPYLIHAVFPITEVKNVVDLKNYLGVDTAFKQNSTGNFIFCNEVTEPEYEEI